MVVTTIDLATMRQILSLKKSKARVEAMTVCMKEKEQVLAASNESLKNSVEALKEVNKLLAGVPQIRTKPPVRLHMVVNNPVGGK